MAEHGKSGIIDWQIPTFLVITGASRGLGAQIAVDFSKRLCQGSEVLLIARDKSKLEDVKEIISCLTTKVIINLEALDVSLLDSPSYSHFFSKWSALNFPQVILINNAGTLGDISKTALKCTSANEIRDYFSMNVESMIFLTTGFINALSASPRKLLINISSLAAQKPFKGWSLYCTGKAARDMYFRVLAEEEPDIMVLNYAPGPLKTDMLSQIFEQAIPDIKEQFLTAQSQDQLLTCEYTVNRLIGVLESAKFKSGDHVDVFDTNY